MRFLPVMLILLLVFSASSAVNAQQEVLPVLWAADTDSGIQIYGLTPTQEPVMLGALPGNHVVSEVPREGRSDYDNSQGPDDVWSIPIPTFMIVISSDPMVLGRDSRTPCAPPESRRPPASHHSAGDGC